MLLLILTHRHQMGLIQQNVRRHEAGVGKQAGVDVIRVGRGFILKLGHARELAEHGVAVEHPGKLGVLRHMGLDENDALVGVQPAGDKLGKQLQTLAAQVGGVLPHGDGVLIHHAVHGVVLVLQQHPVAQGSQIIAQGDFSAGLSSAEYDLLLLRHIETLLATLFYSKSLS
ncbi:hypothetical protein SDC9_83688 [bioreactor metagenome]|uniref:Uncharacterized protein n=1 Tax=bioreactor metagenome TaxID=1076179 RepID=A0A644Z8E1_9ZZZZ